MPYPPCLVACPAMVGPCSQWAAPTAVRVAVAVAVLLPLLLVLLLSGMVLLISTRWGTRQAHTQ